MWGYFDYWNLQYFEPKIVFGSLFSLCHSIKKTTKKKKKNYTKKPKTHLKWHMIIKIVNGTSKHVFNYNAFQNALKCILVKHDFRCMHLKLTWQNCPFLSARIWNAHLNCKDSFELPIWRCHFKMVILKQSFLNSHLFHYYLSSISFENLNFLILIHF